MVNSHQAYVEAVNENNPDLVYKYIIKDTELYREYRRNIPTYTVKLENKGQTIKSITKEGEKYIVSCTNKFNMKYKDGQEKYEEEENEYIVQRDRERKKLLIPQLIDITS